MSRIYYTKPSITDLEVQYVSEAARIGWGERCYEYIGKLEQAFKQHLGVDYAIATSSCTGALHMGLAALGVSAGDEVILADINWVASAAPITYLGAVPVLVDIDPKTWCIDPNCAEAAITSKTKAIIATHLYGNLCDMDRLLRIGKKHNIPVIEDAAEAIGSTWRGARAGSLGKFGAFSFHGTKTITTAEGGMFVTNDADLFETVSTLSNHGRARGQMKQFWPDQIGFKYKMSNLRAALGCAQMERIDELIVGKTRIFDAYKSRLKNAPVQLNCDQPKCVNGYWMPTIVVDEKLPFDRDDFIASFVARNIDARVFFWPLSQTGHFEKRFTNPVSCKLSPRGVNLPSYHDLTDAEIDRVCSVVEHTLSR